MIKPYTFSLLTLLAVVTSACKPVETKITPEISATNFGQQDPFDVEWEQQKLENVNEYFLARANPKGLGWTPLENSPNDVDGIDCFAKLTETTWSKSYSDIQFLNDSIKTIILDNGQKIAQIDVDAVTEYGQKTKFRAIVRLDMCRHFKGRNYHENVFISPASGEISYSDISPEGGDKSLLFRKLNTAEPFEVYANTRENGLMVIERPVLSKAIFLEDESDKGCLFSILEQGEKVAQTVLLSDLCPNSKSILEPQSIEYGLNYYWFGQKKINALKAKIEADQDTDEILANSQNITGYEGEHILDMRLGVLETPRNKEIDLSTEGYFWSPFVWHKAAWQKGK